MNAVKEFITEQLYCPYEDMCNLEVSYCYADGEVTGVTIETQTWYVEFRTNGLGFTFKTKEEFAIDEYELEFVSQIKAYMSEISELAKEDE